MKITDEMIEAGAKEIHDIEDSRYETPRWDDLSSVERDGYLRMSREILEAARGAALTVGKRADEAGNERQKCLGCGRYVSECCLTLDERMARARAKGFEFVGAALAVAPEKGDLSEIIAAVLEAHVGRIGTHYEDCWKYHAGCLALLLRDIGAVAPPKNEATCTCPTGDGSLRWPCKEHPPKNEGEKK